MIKKAGVIGLGVIGKPIALRLLKAGFEVAVHDIRAEPVTELANAGAIACASAADVATHSEIIISLVMDAAQTDDVVSGANGVLRKIKPDTLFATGSTLGPASVHRVAAALAARGCETIDMPITGGFVAAYEGKLALMVGADEQALKRALPVFRAFASTSSAQAASARDRWQNSPIN